MFITKTCVRHNSYSATEVVLHCELIAKVDKDCSIVWIILIDMQCSNCENAWFQDGFTQNQITGWFFEEPILSKNFLECILKLNVALEA